MAKMFKLCRDRKRIKETLEENFKIEPAYARLIGFLGVCLYVVHLLACLWVIAAKVNEDKNWIASFKANNFAEDYEMSNSETYLISFYAMATTITTVGYGDISAKNNIESIFAIIFMLVGVVLFSFVAGSLTSIITDRDSQQASLKLKLATLEGIQKQHDIPREFYREMKRTINFEHSKSVDGLGDLLASLPLKLKIDLGKLIHKDVEEFLFFKQLQTENLKMSESFLSWVGHRLLPRLCQRSQYIYQTSEEITGIFFIKYGKVAFVISQL